ncbi:DNA topoisomerase IV subunit A [bacterium]|nr:DNA topoisomerase IV subunit A [bacterium]
MAKKSKEIEQFVDSKIQTEYLESIMGDRFGSYAKYIIQDRAIPDVRDGLKPVQRRILYAMKAVGMVYGEPYKKSARIVGEVIGKYHPHGDSSVYDALVRMSQDFKINLPLIDMHGNNGSIDGDSAAAMRYTEARLSLAAMYLLKDIDKKTVTFIPNYDDSEIEPVVLPAKFPNLLVNGADGISAGYATNIPPHNLNETVRLTIERIKNPNISVDEAMAILPGPDFPTGGIIHNTKELRDAFTTGRGKVVIRSKSKVEGHNIIINEIPYGVNKANLVKKIDSIASSKKIDGIIEVRDESDKEGLRIVIETKNESNPSVILNYLLKNTELQINFSYNLVAIVDRSPMILGILDVIDAYINHTKEMIRNRSYYEIDKAKKRLHIVEGLVKLVAISDDVIHTIKQSNGKAESKTNIMKIYGFTELQAEAIVTLQLYRLSKYNVEELIQEKANLEKEIKKLEYILSNENALKKVIIQELEEINEKIVSPRRTEITEEDHTVTVKEEELIIPEDVRVLISKDGYIKRLSLKSYIQSVDTQSPGLKDNDFIIFDEECNTMDTILLFTTYGSYINLPVYKIPEIKYKELGTYIGSIFDLTGADRIVGINHIKDQPVSGTKVLLSTRLGKIKLMVTDEFFEKRYRRGLAMKLLEGDTVISASLESADTEEVVTVTKYGHILKYAKSEVSIAGAKAVGVKNINLKRGDEVVISMLVPNYYKEELLLLTNRGGLKRIYLSEIARTKRLGFARTYLKAVKSNPYYCISAIVTNPSKYKDSIEIDIQTDSEILKIKGNEMPRDTYENGIPLINNKLPISINLKIINKNLYQKYENELHKELQKNIQEIKDAHPNSLIDELGEIIEKQTTMYDFMNDNNDTNVTSDSDFEILPTNLNSDFNKDDKKSIDDLDNDELIEDLF